MEPDLETLVEQEQVRDAQVQPPREGADALGVREEDFARMAAALGMSAGRLGELLGASSE
jgi:hypothetical protein